VADNATGSQLTSLTAATTTTTSYVYSSTFTGTNAKVADGIVLFLRRVNTTGTVSVALSDDNGVTATRSVTVNASDLPAQESWVFFKFGTTLTLDGGTDYRVGVLGSSAGNASVLRDGTAGNWGRIISTTDTAAPAAGDTMLIVGELTGAGASTAYTVTMDNTATTDFGTGVAALGPSQSITRVFNGIQIGKDGTLTWGASAATAYYLKLSGALTVWSGGTYNMGTVATPCPRDSTMYLQFDCVAANDFGLNFMNESTANIQGLSRTSGNNNWYCKLNTDEAVASTSLGVDTDTGWLDNDLIAISATTRTYTQCEAGALNGNAGTSTLTVDGFAGAGGGLAFAHSGTAPTQAEIILLTRNVRISGASATAVAQISGFNVNFNADWVECFWISAATFSVSSTANTIDIHYCCFRETTSTALFQSGSNLQGVITISNNAFYNTGKSSFGGGAFASQSSQAVARLTFTDNIAVLPSGTGGGAGIGFGGSGTFTGNTIAGSSGQSATATLVVAGSSLSNNTFHSCQGPFSMALTTGYTITIDGIKSWRNNIGGMSVGMSADSTTTGTPGSYITITNSSFFGNQNYNLLVSGGVLTFDNVSVNGDTSFSTADGLRVGGGITLAEVNNSTFGVASGILTTHTNDLNLAAVTNATPQFVLNNTTLASANEVANQSSAGTSAFVKSSKHDQTEGAFKSWIKNGRIERDTTIFNTAAPSERLTPISASLKLQSGPRLVAVDDGSTVTINAYVRKSVVGDGAAYNGNQPRLIVRKNLACGITSDTVLDTMTAAAGSWEQLTGTTATVDADGALEFFVDCDGTTGWINVDDWTVT
jgi:hypothetical protein